MKSMLNSKYLGKGRPPITPHTIAKGINSLPPIPKKAPYSGAMESLISHNEDLMSRLKVALRRISAIEEHLNQSEKMEKKRSFHYKNLKDQVLVLKEKEKRLRNRKEISESHFHSLNEKVRMLEVEYARLYTSSQKKKITFMDTINDLSRQVMRLKKGRSKLSIVAHELRKSFQSSQNEFSNLKERITIIQTKLTDSTNYIQEQAQKFKESQARDKDEYQRELNALNKELTEAKKMANQFNEVYDENVKIQNQLIFLRRKRDDSRDEFNTEISKAQEGLAYYRSQAKSQALTIKSYSSELEEKNNLITELKEERDNLKDQFESVQCLWKDNQESLEKQFQKNEALQNLNQQVSTQLNRYRQDLKDLRHKFESEKQESSQELQKMKAYLTAIQSFSTNPPLSDRTLLDSPEADLQKETPSEKTNLPDESFTEETKDHTDKTTTATTATTEAPSALIE